MTADPRWWKQSLSGRQRHRVGLFGKMVLQVEIVHECMKYLSDEPSGQSYTDWRDATAQDLLPISAASTTANDR